MELDETHLDLFNVRSGHLVSWDVLLPCGKLGGEVVGVSLSVVAQIVEDISPSLVRKRPQDSGEERFTTVAHFRAFLLCLSPAAIVRHVCVH